MKASRVQLRHRGGEETERGSKGSRLWCRIGGISGLVLLAGGINLTFGGVFANLRFDLSGIELPPSCLASGTVLLGVYLIVLARLPGESIAPQLAPPTSGRRR